MPSNVYDVVVDFEICGFTKNTKIKMSWEWNIIYPSNKKKQFNIKSYNMAQNSFPIELKTFNNLVCLKNY